MATDFKIILNLAMGAVLSNCPPAMVAARELADRESWLMSCAMLGATEADALKHESIILALAYTSLQRNHAVMEAGRIYYQRRLALALPPPVTDVDAWLDGFIAWAWLGSMNLVNLDIEEASVFALVKSQHLHWYDLARKLWAE